MSGPSRMPSTEQAGELYVVRHGATEWSVNGRHTGRTDLPLLPDGEAQARAVGRLLDGRPFALVLASPLRRARHTCELAGYDSVAEIDDDLLEWDYGDLEGLTSVEIRSEIPDWTVFDGPVPGGETLAQVATARRPGHRPGARRRRRQPGRGPRTRAARPRGALVRARRS